MNTFKNALNALYLYRNGYLETLDKERYSSIVGKSFYFRLFVILTRLIKEFQLLFYKNPKLNINNKIVCIVNSKNNYEALKFITSSNVVFLKPTVHGESVKDVTTYRFNSKFFFSIFFIISLPFIISNKTNRRDLLLIHGAFGLTFLFSQLLKKQRPLKVIFANDHIPEARSYIFACQNMGIKTIYIQHGSVSKYFPPLEFDLALLESEYSSSLYAKGENIDTAIELIGIPKIDKEILKIRQRKRIKKIGIAVNQNDDIHKIENLIDILIKNDYEVLLRKHPADIREIKSDHKVENGNAITVFKFILLSDFIIASDSSIHVEANSLRCRSVYYQLHDNANKYDYYGFVKNKYVEEVRTLYNLIEMLKEFNYETFNFSNNKMTFYNSAIASDYYGESSKRALKIIRND
jgi:hypothetical protein